MGRVQNFVNFHSNAELVISNSFHKSSLCRSLLTPFLLATSKNPVIFDEDKRLFSKIYKLSGNIWLQNVLFEIAINTVSRGFPPEHKTADKTMDNIVLSRKK